MLTKAERDEMKQRALVSPNRRDNATLAADVLTLLQENEHLERQYYYEVAGWLPGLNERLAGHMAGKHIIKAACDEIDRLRFMVESLTQKLAGRNEPDHKLLKLQWQEIERLYKERSALKFRNEELIQAGKNAAPRNAPLVEDIPGNLAESTIGEIDIDPSLLKVFKGPFRPKEFVSIELDVKDLPEDFNEVLRKQREQLRRAMAGGTALKVALDKHEQEKAAKTAAESVKTGLQDGELVRVTFDDGSMLLGEIRGARMDSNGKVSYRVIPESEYPMIADFFPAEQITRIGMPPKHQFWTTQCCCNPSARDQAELAVDAALSPDHAPEQRNAELGKLTWPEIPPMEVPPKHEFGTMQRCCLIPVDPNTNTRGPAPEEAETAKPEESKPITFREFL